MGLIQGLTNCRLQTKGKGDYSLVEWQLIWKKGANGLGVISLRNFNTEHDRMIVELLTSCHAKRTI